MTQDITVEIVTFRLRKGANAQALPAAAEGLSAFLSQAGGFVSRQLTVDTDGLWTDYLLWKTAEDAHRAAKNMPNAPGAGDFMALIDPESITMRHASLTLSQD